MHLATPGRFRDGGRRTNARWYLPGCRPARPTCAQVTIASRNPNDRVGVYYKTLDAFTTYRDEPVTVPVSMPSIYQGHKDVSVWSPVMSGDAVPVAQYVADAMKQDIAAGYVLLHVKVEGRVKWKVGSWVSGGYHLFVTCPVLQRRAFMSFYQPLDVVTRPNERQCYLGKEISNWCQIRKFKFFSAKYRRLICFSAKYIILS